MKLIYLKNITFIIVLLLTMTDYAVAQRRSRAVGKQKIAAVQRIEERNVLAQMEFLAGDAIQGRGSGTQFEFVAAEYIGSQLRQFGVEPAGESNVSGAQTYVQTVNITRNVFAEAPKLSCVVNGKTVSLEHGKEIVVLRMNTPQISGALEQITLDDTPKKGAVVLIKLWEDEDVRYITLKVQKILNAGASAVIVDETTPIRAQWNDIAKRPISFTTVSNNSKGKVTPSNIIVVNEDTFSSLAQHQGTNIEIKGELAAPQKQQTWNAVGKITGSDRRLASEVILLSAHLDHLGVRPNAAGADKIFNGADDDASGCVAVLELARVLAEGRRPKRTVYFTFFGSEEAGGYGAQYFVDNLAFPKDKLVANLEFEMIGRPDAKVKPEELWLTGYERSNLGAELARRGAKLVADPHPEQNFFRRSDNYTLARQGVIAHTVSSFGLHADYHQASDEVKTIDFKHMTRAINSMVAPIEWLVNSNFKPVWYEGKKP